MHRPLLVAALLVLAPPSRADDASDLAAKAAAAFEGGKFAEAAMLAEAAAKADPRNPEPSNLAGSAHARLRDHAAAVAAFTESLKRDPKQPRVRDRRGDEYLKNGQFTEALADFDAYLEAEPTAAPEHWRRGIALYYAGRYADGVKQFDLHRTVNPEDVENSAWHYLCNARANGAAKARAALLPVGKDARVPMKEVLGLFAGKLEPADVLAAAESPALKGGRQTSARFYANLYVALYHEAQGDAKRAKEHLTTAVEKHEVPDYMWDVAKAHLGTLKK